MSVHFAPWVRVPDGVPKSGRKLSSARFGSSSHVLEAGKQKPGSEAFTIYVNDMARNASKKARFFAQALGTLQTQPTGGKRLVVDIGCCGGDMIRELENLLPDFSFLGIDMNLEMLKMSREKDKVAYRERGNPGEPPGRYLQADGFEMPFAARKVDAFTLSSLMHEIFSYAEPNFSRDKLGEFFRHMHAKLKPGGRVIIRDPGRPDNPDEPLVIRAIPDAGKANPLNDRELLAIHPGRLGPDGLLRRFILQFKPAEGQVQALGKNTYRMPAWLVSEFLRHRKLNDTAEHWDSEMREQYGVFTSDEMRTFAIRQGFVPRRIVSTFDPNNHAANYQGEFVIQNLRGEEIDQATRLPTHLYVELEKPRNAAMRLELMRMKMALAAKALLGQQ